MINPRNSFDDDTEVSFVPMPLISEGYANCHSQEVRIWKSVKTGFTHFQENDIAVAKITPCFENRKSVIFRNLINGFGAGTTELHIMRPYSKEILPEYMLWLVKSQPFIEKGIQHFTGAVGQQRVGKSYIEDYLVPVPQKNETKIICQTIERHLAILSEIEKSLS